MYLTGEEQLLLAARVATRAHHGQVRKDGTPYIAHPMRVALRLSGETTRMIVALLHDVVEDTDVTFDELRELGFSSVVVDAVDSVTKRPGEKYSDFILRCKNNAVGLEVKIADISDNIEDQSALDPEEAAFLRKRYTKALAVLKNA